ncbi:MAG TPA: amidase [Arsenicitalea sp.]|nr:amidase [Arsenicitalea sp.]
MTPDDIHYQPMSKVADAIKRGEVSPVDLTELMLKRIAAVDPGLKAFTTVTADLALQQAKRAEAELAQGKYRGPMHGIPIAVKDLCFTKGIKTTAGMTIHEDFKPDHDATVVTRLEQAGAVLLGKLHMTEGATMEHHPELPQPVNPWNKDVWTGVSSSGSGIAPAAGLCYGSIGSDTGGSIRFPSACNGVTGVKPTWGRVSRFGIFDLAATFDHLGPMTRSAADSAIMLKALAGHDPKDPTSLSTPVPDYYDALDGADGARGVIVGLDWDYIGGGATALTVAMMEDVVAVLGDLRAVLRPVQFPDTIDLFATARGISAVEIAAAHAATFPSQANRYGEHLRTSLERGHAASPIDIGKSNIARLRFKGAVMSMFDEVDVIVAPVFRKGTPTWAEARDYNANDIESLMRFTMPFNASGHPTVTLPCGYTDDSRPIAFQLIGGYGSEALLLKVAHAYQQVTDHHMRRPQGF